MSGPDRPTTDTDSQAWWEQLRGGSLTINACRSCGRNSLYTRPFCPHCWSEDVVLRAAGGRATLYTWTVVHQNAPPFDDRVPYVVAMVDLAEGPRLMTAIADCPPEKLVAGMELTLTLRVDDDDGFAIPVFVPVSP